MELVKSNTELNVGDWLMNEPVFIGSDEKYIWEVYTLAKIKNISREGNICNVKLKCWFIEKKNEVEVKENSGSIDPKKPYYKLKESEIPDSIMKNIMLNNLK